LPDPAGSYAVLVGVSSYRRLTPLPAVANNIAALADMLLDRDGWGLPMRHCHLVEDPESVDAVLGPIHQAAEAASDALLVYFAGHGLLDQTSELYLGLPDSTAERLHRAVRYAEIRREIAITAGRCRAKVVILDCCYSGAAVGQFMADPQRLANQAAVDGAYLMTATAATALALAPTNARHTAFTGAILETISSGIPDGPPLLDMHTLYNSVETTLRARHQPTPQSLGRGTGAQIVIARNRHVAPQAGSAPAVGAAKHRAAGETVVERGRQRPAEPSAASSDTAPSQSPNRRSYRRRMAAALITGLAFTGLVLTAASVAPYLRPLQSRPGSSSATPTGTTAALTRSTAPSGAATGASMTATPTNQTSARTPTASPSTASNKPAGAVTAAGNILSPADKADVQTCAYFTGTATLPPGKTLVLAKRNLSTGSTSKYIEYVFGWDHPQTTWSWRGAQYFGNGEDSVGQQYLVELMSVDLTAAQQARSTGNNDTLAATGSVLAERKVNRVTGTAPNNCEGPPPAALVKLAPPAPIRRTSSALPSQTRNVDREVSVVPSRRGATVCLT
jgi:hypothetical protein